MPASAHSKGAKVKPVAPFDLAAALADESWIKDFRDELTRTKRKLATYLSTTRHCVEELGSKRVDASGKRSPHAERLRELVNALELTPEDIGTLLTLPEDRRIAQAQEIVAERKKQFVAIAAFIAWRFRASRTPRVALPGDNACKTAGAVARECLQFYYDHFFVYDMIAFPMQQGTESGETSEVEVYRVSPEDANQLVVEGADGRKKLAGTVLMNFGAFLERSWRRNDILWGRLDGAERLIRTILPGEDAAVIRKELIDEAHDAILAEDLSADQAKTLTQAFLAKLFEQKPNATSADVEQTVREFAGSPDLSAATAAVLRASLTPERIRKHFASPDYKPPPLDANRAARTVTRTVNIIGHMLGRLGNEQLTLGGRWLARFARLCWWIVEAASPQSLRNIITRHLVTVVFIAAIVLVVVGTFSGIQGAANVGWLVLAAAIVFFFFVALLKDIFAKRKRKALLTLAVVLLGILLFVPLAIGLREIWRWVKPPAVATSPATR